MKTLIGGLIVKSMPGTPMTEKEILAQNKMVSQASRATDYFSEDELEDFANKKLNEQQ